MVVSGTLNPRNGGVGLTTNIANGDTHLASGQHQNHSQQQQQQLHYPSTTLAGQTFTTTANGSHHLTNSGYFTSSASTALYASAHPIIGPTPSIIVNPLSQTEGGGGPMTTSLSTSHQHPQAIQTTVMLGSSLSEHRTANPSSMMLGTETCQQDFTPQKNRTFYLLVFLIILGISVMVITVLTAVVIFFKYSEKIDLPRKAAGSSPPPSLLSGSTTSKTGNSLLSMHTDPCRDFNCPFGGVCVYDSRIHSSSQPECRCPDTCPLDKMIGVGENVPVCGSDGRTYSSECDLFLASCKLKVNIIIDYVGPCGGGGKQLSNPCREITCDFGSVCVERIRGSNLGSNVIVPECSCPDKCSRYFQEVDLDSDGKQSSSASNNMTHSQLDIRLWMSGQSEDTPVCGSDGSDYSSLCQLKSTSCSEKRHITARFIGKCDPCRNFDCPSSSICQVDKDTRAPHCSCDDRVCEVSLSSSSSSALASGEGGQQRQHQLRLQQPTVSFRFNSSVYLSPSLLSSPLPSVKDEHTVCASDGRSYPSECYVENKSCRSGIKLRTISKGNCVRGQHPCHTLSCPEPMDCTADRYGIAQCVCPPPCPPIWNPLCGSDGVTYDSECHFHRAKCLLLSHIQSENKLLSPPHQSHLQHQHHHHHNQKHHQHSPATSGIETNDHPSTSSSSSHSQALTIVHRGQCTLESSSKSPSTSSLSSSSSTTAVSSVEDEIEEDNDGGTGRDSDSLDETSITFESSLCQFLECPVGSLCRVRDRQNISSVSYRHQTKDKEAFCDCRDMCSHIRDLGLSSPYSTRNDAVCGSDGRLYDNECKLHEEACRHQQELKVQPYHFCHESKVIPCDGDPPLHNNLTGKELNCGHEGKTCPSGSFCHKTPHFAKCCKEKTLVKSCEISIYGCCPDGKTSSQGPNRLGCPSICPCNRLGSSSLACDSSTKQCQCKPGVGGVQCDRCEAGFWGLHKISEGKSGCLPCSCNVNGSLRDDCEQMTGRCVCKPGVQGMKCDECPPGLVLTIHGCTDESISRTTSKSCSQMVCLFGSKCKETSTSGGGRKAQCVCDGLCDQRANDGVASNGNHSAPFMPSSSALVSSSSSPTVGLFSFTPVGNNNKEGNNKTRNNNSSKSLTGTEVCGSDGKTYKSEAELRCHSCRIQESIIIIHPGPCRNVYRFEGKNVDDDDDIDDDEDEDDGEDDEP